MVSDNRDLTGVSKLGNNSTKYDYEKPDVSILETFVNQHPDTDYLITFKIPEFTSLCPKTGQPDFATIYVQYIPQERCVESKSLKLYMFSYRNFGEFHEDCVCRIGKDLIEKMDPKYIRVEGQFRPRGGISIVPVFEYEKEGYHVKDNFRERVEHDYSVT
jgi:7-cyano-7-deazaguanine reductase